MDASGNEGTATVVVVVGGRCSWVSALLDDDERVRKGWAGFRS